MRFLVVAALLVFGIVIASTEADTFESVYQDPISVEQQVPEDTEIETDASAVKSAKSSSSKIRIGHLGFHPGQLAEADAHELVTEEKRSDSKKAKKKGCGSPVCMRWSKLSTDTAEMVMLAETSMSEAEMRRIRVRCATSAAHPNGMHNGQLGQTRCQFLNSLTQRRCEKYKTSCVKFDRTMPSTASMVTSIESGVALTRMNPPKPIARMTKKDGAAAAKRIITQGGGPAARVSGGGGAGAGFSSRISIGKAKAKKSAQARWLYWKNKFAMLQKKEGASKASKKAMENTIKEARTKATERSIKHHQALRRTKEKHRKADESKTKEAYTKSGVRKEAKRKAAKVAEKKSKAHAAKVVAMKETQAKTAERLAGKSAEERLGKKRFESASKARNRAVRAAKKEEKAVKAVKAEKALKASEKKKKHERSVKVTKAKERKAKEGKLKEHKAKVGVAKEELEKLKLRVRLAANRRERTRKEGKEKERSAKAKIVRAKKRKENKAKEKVAKEKRVKRLKAEELETKAAERDSKKKARERKGKARRESASKAEARAAAAAKRAADLAKRLAAAKAAEAARVAAKAARGKCACSGAVVKSSKSLRGTKVGGACDLHEKGDKQPWCFTKGKCVVAGKTLALRNKKHWKKCAAKDVKTRVHWSVLLAGKGAIKSGDIQVQLFGRQAKDKSKTFTIKGSGVARGKWLKRTFEVPKSLSWVDRVMMRFTSKSESITIADHHVRFEGHFAVSFKRGVTMGGNTDVGPEWTRLTMAKNPTPGNAKLKASMEDARTVQMLPGVLHTVIVPRIARVSKQFIISKIKGLGKKIQSLNKQFQKKQMNSKQFRTQVKALLRNMLGKMPQRRVTCRTQVERAPAAGVPMGDGYGDGGDAEATALFGFGASATDGGDGDGDSDFGGSDVLAPVPRPNPVVQTCKSTQFDPLGMLFSYQPAGKPAVFNNVWENKSVVVVSFKPGYTLDIVPARTGIPNSIATSRSVTPPQLPHGNFLATLTWGKKPDDLDLYVIVPKAKKAIPATELFGGFGASAAPSGPTTGKSVYWGDPGHKKRYPFAKLDVDDMDGKGPETITMYKAITPGTYQFFVDCFSCMGKAAFKQFRKGGSVVKIYDKQGLVVDQKISTAKLTAKGEPAKFWLVATKTCVQTDSGVSCSYKFPNKFVEQQPI